jgi:uncharacterized membrane protein YcaP (DUF421 family)
MDTVLRAAAVYIVVLLVLRLAGRRTVAEMTPFDLVLLLIIGDATQQALLGDDFSLTTAFLVVATLIVLDILLSLLKERFASLAKLIDGVPMVIVENGQPLRERMRRARVSMDDVMLSARESQGIERLEEIKFAVLEVSGGISIIPRETRH